MFKNSIKNIDLIQNITNNRLTAAQVGQDQRYQKPVRSCP